MLIRHARFSPQRFPTNMKILLLLPALTYSQLDTNASFNTLCSYPKASNLLYSFCTRNPEQSKNSSPIVANLCKTEFMDNEACSSLLQQCQSSNCTLSNSQQDTSFVFMICNEMPMMIDCENCPPPCIYINRQINLNFRL